VAPNALVSDVTRRQPDGALHNMWLLAASITGSMLGPGELDGVALATATPRTGAPGCCDVPVSQGFTSAAPINEHDRGHDGDRAPRTAADRFDRDPTGWRFEWP